MFSKTVDCGGLFTYMYICHVKLAIVSPLDSHVLSNGVNCEEDVTLCGAACQHFCVLWDQEGSVACATHHLSTHCLHLNLCHCEIINGKGKGHPRTGHRGPEGV
jgi:hypothetical protein